MTSPPEFDAVLDAVRRAFVDGAGAPVTTGVRALGPAETRAVLGSHVAVAVTDPALLANLVPGKEVARAIAVAADDGEHGAVVYTTAETGELPSAVATAIDAVAANLARTVRRLQSEAAVLDALHSTGRELTAQLDIDRIVQDATDAATKATGAGFGAFFYNLVDEFGESYTLYTLSGVRREAFAAFPMPRNTAVFGPTFDGTGTVRSPDITKDPRFGKNAPYHGMPAGHLPVCSYLAVPVLSPTSGEVLGGSSSATRNRTGSPSGTNTSPRASPATRPSRWTTPASTNASGPWPRSWPAACCRWPRPFPASKCSPGTCPRPPGARWAATGST
jgi:hypothetical protein